MKAMALILAGVVLPLSSRAADLKALDSKAKLTSDVIALIEEIMGNKPAEPQRFRA